MIDRTTFLAGLGALPFSRPLTPGRRLVDGSTFPALYFDSGLVNPNTALMWGSTDGVHNTLVSAVSLRSFSLVEQHFAGYISFGTHWPMVLNVPYTVPGTQYQFTALGEITVQGPPHYPIRRGDPPPPNVTGVNAVIASLDFQFDTCEIAYFATINAYRFLYYWQPDGLQHIRWVQGPPISPDGRIYPFARFQQHSSLDALRTGRFIDIEGYKIELLRSQEHATSYPLARFRHASHVKDAAGDKACQLATADLFIGAGVFIGATIALISILPATALACVAASLLYGGGVWGIARLFQAAADQCQSNAPENPIIRDGNGRDPNYNSYGSSGFLGWGNTPSFLPDGRPFGGHVTVSGYACGGVDQPECPRNE